MSRGTRLLRSFKIRYRLWQERPLRQPIPTALSTRELPFRRTFPRAVYGSTNLSLRHLEGNAGPYIASLTTAVHRQQRYTASAWDCAREEEDQRTTR